MKYSSATAQVPLEPLARALEKDPGRAVLLEEFHFARKMKGVWAAVLERQTPVLLVCGPSSSGKTTTARRIAARLGQSGKPSHIISLDDFYKDRDQPLPRWPDGAINYESPQCLDLDLLDSKMKELWQRGRATFPVFDFHRKERRTDMGIEIAWTPDSYLILEGIHALNPMLDGKLGGYDPLRLYISVHSDFVDGDGRVVLGARELRLSRRILRDIRHRASPVTRTLELWGGVLRGEELYIRPYRDYADIHIDTTHGYEPFLYAQTLTQHLQSGGDYGDYRFLVNRMLAAQESFRPRLDSEIVPFDSLLREFL